MVRLPWVEVLKATALVWIVWNHVVERVFGFPLAGNPAADWPPLADRIAQLAPLTGQGWLDIPLNLVRWIGWAGDQGVGLFLIVGGFGLTWGLLARSVGATLPLRDFWRRRALRIYPLWWAAHLFFLIPCLLLGRGLDPAQSTFWLDLLGVRVTPYQLYYFAPSWWYVGLLIQLCAVYPLLWAALRRLGPARFLAASLALGFVARAAGLLLFHDYLDAWSRGAIFVTRLPEFALGMALAGWMHAAPVATDAWLRARATRAAALVALATGVVLSLGLLGMTVAPFLLAAAVFALLYAPASLWASWTRRVGLARQAHVLALPRAASLHRPLRAARDRRRRGAYRGRRGRRTRAHRDVGDLARVVRRRLPAAGATHRVARRCRRPRRRLLRPGARPRRGGAHRAP